MNGIIDAPPAEAAPAPAPEPAAEPEPAPAETIAAWDRAGYTPLHLLCGGATWGQLDARLAGIRLLITKGAAVDAVDDYGMRPLDYVSGYRRICLTLLRAGAALPACSADGYLRKVIAAGSLQNYERAHLDALAASFAPKFAHLLPPDLQVWL